MHTNELNDSQTVSNNTQNLSHTIFLVGDVGEGLEDNTNPTLQLLKEKLNAASENSSVLFLGNNIGPFGMSPKSDEENRSSAEKQLDAQLSILEDYKGRPIFIPGDKDWRHEGRKGLKRQEKYIEQKLNTGIEDDDDWNNYFLPDIACSGPEAIAVNDNLVIIIIDSNWWLTNWEQEPNLNNGCDIKSREGFVLAMEDIFKEHKNKNIVFASHHSFRSSGPHAGHFTVKNHLFPFTTVADNAYVPLPVVGSAYLFLRDGGILRNDDSSPKYKSLKQAVLHPAEDYGEFIFVSGHENSLEYHKHNGQHFIVSGAGSKATATSKGGGAEFSYGHVGFSKIDVYEDGSAWVEFWIPEEATEGKMVYRKQIKGPLPKPNPDEIPKDFAIYESGVDSLLTYPSTREIKPLGKLSTFMFGAKRRAVYLEKNKFPTLDLSTFKGGMTVIKKGGGKQTNSLRLAGADGKEYVMRSLTKDSRRGVPYPFNQLAIVNYLFSETFLGSHCFAPPTLGPLSDAANIYHTNPNIYYVPKQPALGTYNDNFGGEVYLVEERASKSWPEADFFGNATKFANTPKVNAKLEKNHKHKVDQKWVARSRLFDILIGDIDRHGDQWRWTVTEDEQGHKTYRPIPRDRDNAYCTYGGFSTKLLKPYHYIVRMLGEYKDEVPNPKWTYYNARHFDHHFLNELSLDDWLNEAAYIQENVTDEVIAEAMSKFPDRIYELTGPDIANVLKARRDNLKDTARRMYEYVAKQSVIRGTAKKEFFEIVRKDAENTEVKMYDTNKKGEKQELIYSRVFKTSDTDELYIYGLGDDDIFHISGDVKKSIKIYVIGGPGRDVFTNISKVGGFGKKDRFYDTKKGNTYDLGSETKNKTSNIARNNTFEYLGTQFDASKKLPVPLIGYNSGDGFTLGAMGIFHITKFNKHPLGQKHVLRGNYAFRNGGFAFDYNGVFYQSIFKSDFVINTFLRTNRFAFNYFGLGNDSTQEVDDELYYQVQQSQGYLDFGWQRRFANDVGAFSIRPLAQWTDLSSPDANTFLNERVDLTDQDFESKVYLGAITSLTFANVDNPTIPRDGFSFKNNFRWQQSVDDNDGDFYTFGTDLIIYKSFGLSKKLVFASRAGAEFIRGDYQFYFAPTLGQDENLRGYYGQRFRGESTFYHMTDLRYELGAVNNPILPFTIGLTGSFDYGRIFSNEAGANSDWHGNFGGGFWIVPLNLAIVSFSYNRSIDGEGGRFLVGIGHAF